MRLMRAVPLFIMLPLIAACETPTTQRYAVLAANNQMIRTLNTTGVAVGEFAPPAAFNPQCRLAGTMRVADGLTHTQYIQRAFADELTMAGVVAVGAPRVVLTGKVEKLEFSSMREVVGGSWTIDLTLTSSNGSSMSVSELYPFESGFNAHSACKEAADAYLRAVQNVVGKTVADPRFRELIR
jgi:hypothetical protein